MRHSLAVALSIGVVIGAVLAPGATIVGTDAVAAAASFPAHAITRGPARHSPTSTGTPTHGPVPGSNAPAGSDPPTIVTFAVTSGALTLTAPSSANIGSGVPNQTISGLLGQVVVTDNRALLSATWTATASSTDFTTGGGTTAETIPVADADYDPGTVTHTGTITIGSSDITLSGTAQSVVTGSSGVGNNTATWDPEISVLVPAGAVGGTYTGTITESVA